MHLVVDGFGGDQDRMWDTQLVRTFLDELPSSLGMTKICEPQVLRYDAPDAQDSGVSGFVIIAESHISIHTFPYRDYVNVDVFSCKPFDHERALDDVKELFLFQEVKTWILDRGLEYLEVGEPSNVLDRPIEARPIIS